jgi:hypothetical protein
VAASTSRVTHHSADRAAYVRTWWWWCPCSASAGHTRARTRFAAARATTLPRLALPCHGIDPQSDPPLPASCTVYTQYKYIQTKIRQWCASPLIFFLKSAFETWVPICTLLFCRNIIR